MISIKRSMAAVALTMSVGACSFESNAPEEMGSTSEAVEVTEVAVATVGEARIVFLQVAGEADITLEEQASSFALETPMQQLWGRGLTSLEIFQALAPEQALPQELVAAHAREAQALGREEAIRQVSLDMTRLVEKSVTPTQCSVMFNSPYTSNYQSWVNQVSLNDRTGTQALCGGFTCQHSYTYPDTVILLGICNSDSSRTLPYRVYTKAAAALNWSFFNRTAAVNSINAQYRIQTFAHNDKIEGRPAQSDLVYHLRAAMGRHL